MAGTHVNPETGKSGKCSAEPGNYPLKTESGESFPYFSNDAEARRYIERESAREKATFTPMRKGASVAELEARAVELTQEVARPYKEARARHKQAHGELHAVREAVQ